LRVRMKIHITGYRDGVEWPAKGGVIDVPAGEAEDLVAQGYAEHVAGDDNSAGDTVTTTSPTPDDVPGGRVEVVLAWVDGNPDAARLALDYELSRAKPRKGLVAQLTEIAAQGGDDETTTGDTGAGDAGAAGPDGPPAGPADAAAAGGPDGPPAGDEAASRPW